MHACCSVWFCFSCCLTFDHAPGLALKNRAPSAGGQKTPILTVFCGLSAYQLSQQVREISGVVFGQPSENEALENDFNFAGPAPLSGLQWVWSWHFSWEWKMPRTAGKVGFLGFQLRTRHHSKNGLSKQRLKSTSSVAPIANFVFLGGAPGFCKNRVSQNHTNFSETAANVVPKWRGQKRSFCTGGSKLGHLRKDPNTCLIPLHLLSHSPSFLRTISLAFSFLNMCPFYHVFSLEYCCAVSTCVSHGSVQFLCSCWLCLLFFFVPLLLILLTHFCFIFFLFFFRFCLFFVDCIQLLMLLFWLLSSSCLYYSSCFPSLNRLC